MLREIIGQLPLHRARFAVILNKTPAEGRRLTKPVKLHAPPHRVPTIEAVQ